MREPAAQSEEMARLLLECGPMAIDNAHVITEILRSWSDGDTSAEDQLWPLVYDELRRMAGRSLRRERAEHTLPPTGLVHEAYLKLVDQRVARFQDRRHFFAIAATIMRRILVDHERGRRAAKRGGGEVGLPIDENVLAGAGREPDLVAVDEALASLEQLDPLKARVVELRFFAGLSYSEAGEVLGCSGKTVQRHWGMARTWLYRELERGGSRLHGV